MWLLLVILDFKLIIIYQIRVFLSFILNFTCIFKNVCILVLKARNLLEKGKGGNDAYCLIGMGKEKFLTSVKPKSLSPVWDEQAEL